MHSNTARRWSMCAISIATLLSATTIHAQHPSGRTTGPTIPQVAKTAGQFGTLLAAVEAAGLTETLLGRGPFTLFAPTDEAFKRLPAGTVENLLKPENREQLRTILTYHVVSGRVLAAQARTLPSAATVAGPRIQISEQRGDLRINDATVRIADVPASNGVVHVIDRVLLPPTPAREGTAMAGASGSAIELLDAAIDRGVPLFNDGQPAATVAIYEVAATGLLSFADVPSDARRTLRNALRSSGSDARERAWTLRRALDETRTQLTGRMSGTR
jgi:uncharacterized surface protein with fasciclin (FAS1) repeats